MVREAVQEFGKEEGRSSRRSEPLEAFAEELPMGSAARASVDHFWRTIET